MDKADITMLDVVFDGYIKRLEERGWEVIDFDPEKMVLTVSQSYYYDNGYGLNGHYEVVVDVYLNDDKIEVFVDGDSYEELAERIGEYEKEHPDLVELAWCNINPDRAGLGDRCEDCPAKELCKSLSEGGDVPSEYYVILDDLIKYDIAEYVMESFPLP